MSAAQLLTDSKLVQIAITLLLLTVLVLNAWCQPLPNGKETTATESGFFSIEVPHQEELNGGHLQGVQLFNGTLIISGSSKKFAYLAIFRKVAEKFKFVATKKLAEDPFNHAGGFQVAEEWLAVGVEDPVGKRSSLIQLVDVSSLEKLSAPPVYTLKRKGEYKRSTAGAVALLKRKDHFLLAVGSWDCTVIDFYTSNHTDPYADDFKFEAWTSWDSREAKRKNWIDRDYNSYQSLQLTEDTTGFYLTGFARSGGKNVADVFRLDVQTDPYDLVQKVGSYSVQCKADVTFRNSGGFTNYNGIPSIIAVGHDLSPKTNIQIFPIKGN